MARQPNKSPQELNLVAFSLGGTLIALYLGSLDGYTQALVKLVAEDISQTFPIGY
jgi:triacylglycerol esterase/lipase EstA (alpha/beta hydrolase family)